MCKNSSHLKMLLLLPMLVTVFAKVQAGPLTSPDNTELLNNILQVVQEQGEQIKYLGEKLETLLLKIFHTVKDLKTEENYLLSVLTGQQTQLATKIDKVEKNQDENQKNIMTKFVKVKKLACDIHHSGLLLINLNDKKYFFSYNQPTMSWNDAHTFCRSHDMDLVSVETQDEWRALQPEIGELYTKIDYPWSSARDSAQKGKWAWSSGRDVAFHASAIMDNSDEEDCMWLGTDNWGDFPCSDKLSFICEVNSDC